VARYQTVSILSRRIPRYRISPSISRPTKHSDGRPAMSLTFCHISVIGMNAKVSKVSNRFFFGFPCFFVFVHTFCLSETMYMHANLLCKLSVLLASTCCNYFRFHFPFLRAAVRAVSLVRSVSLFFFSLLCCMVCYRTNKDR